MHLSFYLNFFFLPVYLFTLNDLDTVCARDKWFQYSLLQNFKYIPTPVSEDFVYLYAFMCLYVCLCFLYSLLHVLCVLSVMFDVHQVYAL